MDQESGADQIVLHPRNGRGLIACGIAALALSVLAVWTLAPVGPLVLPLVIAILGGVALGAAAVARRSAQARLEFAELRRRAREEPTADRQRPQPGDSPA